MLSYQHQYHAGNFADVHKHLTLRLLFDSLLKKDKPFCYIDCHAGSGQYDLMSSEARKTAEYTGGIIRLWNNADGKSHAVLGAYLKAVANLNPDGKLRHYPGSPHFAQQWLRAQDRAHLLELHPQAQSDLRRIFSRDSRISLHARDCHEGLPALVPPSIKRGLVLLDPSYEVKDEYTQVVSLLRKAQKRWSTAIYAIWYPLLPAGQHQQLLEKLKKSGLDKILLSELIIAEPTESEHGNEEKLGMYGSGMAIINAPWKIDDELEQLMPPTADILVPGTGKATLRWLRP